jgi:hypothetical protein
MRVVEVEIITGKGASNVAFILRMKFITDNNGLPFTFRRKQFPLRLAYAMTINKSQGQTFSHVGLHLGDDVFSHGQLYVAFSRAKALMNIKVQLLDTPCMAGLALCAMLCMKKPSFEAACIS